MLVLDLLKSLIKFARISKAGDDDGQYPVQQVNYNNKTGDAFIVFPYGVHANLPTDSLVTVFNVGSNEQNRIAIGGMPSERIKVDVGEVIFYHPQTKSNIYFKSNGDIDIKSISNINIECNELNADCDVANIQANNSLDITTPTATIDGDLIVTGSTTSSGIAVVGSGNTVTVDGKDIGPDHTHSSGSYEDAENRPITGNSGDVN